VGNGHARADSGADELLADPQGLENLELESGVDFRKEPQVFDKFHDRRPMLSGLHFGQDLIGADELAQFHGGICGAEIVRAKGTPIIVAAGPWQADSRTG
jgi:hypothetical protein